MLNGSLNIDPYLDKGGTCLHGAELNPPADVWVWRWRFKPHCLPVCRLQILWNIMSRLNKLYNKWKSKSKTSNLLFHEERLTGDRKPHLKMIGFIFIIQVYFLLKYREWISDEEVCYVLGQQLVNSWKKKFIKLFFIIQTSIRGFWICFWQYLHRAAVCRSPRLLSNQYRCTAHHS